MIKGWTTEPLSSLATIVGRGVAPKYDDRGDYLVVNQRCIRDGRISLGPARRHDSSQRAVRDDKNLQVGDVLVNSTGVGTLGRTAQLRSISSPLIADSHVTIVRPSPLVDSRWLAYSLTLSEPKIEAMAEGSTGQTELSRHRLGLLELPVPPLRIQKAIAAFLGAIDDKIESNLRQQILLRSLGYARYLKSIDTDHREVSLTDVTSSIARGVTPKYADDDPDAPLVVNQRCIRDGRVSLVPARRMKDRVVATSKRASSGDILVNSTGTGTLGRIARWHEGDIFVDSHVSVVKPDSDKVPPTVLAYALLGRQSDVEDMATGSTGQTELSPARLGELRVILPAEDDSLELEHELISLEARIDALTSEIQRLESLRNVLLPELLSGRIRVPSEEIAA